MGEIPFVNFLVGPDDCFIALETSCPVDVSCPLIWDGVVGTGRSNGMLQWNATFDGREVCFFPDKGGLTAYCLS